MSGPNGSPEEGIHRQREHIKDQKQRMLVKLKKYGVRSVSYVHPQILYFTKQNDAQLYGLRTC